MLQHGNQSYREDERIRQQVLAEQVRQIHALTPFGIIAALINSLVVFFIMKTVIRPGTMALWLAAVVLVTAVRSAMLMRFRGIADHAFDARAWKNRYLGALMLIGAVWGAIGIFPFMRVSLAHQVFLAFVLGGMAAGAASSFSVLKEGYLSYTLPSVIPLIVHFFLIGNSFHYAMAGMTVLYGFLLWRISLRHYHANRTSLLLRFENREVIENLQKANEELEQMYGSLRNEIEAKLKLEDELRAYQEHLEATVKQRTIELTRANEDLQAQIEERKRAEAALRENRERLALAQKAGHVGVFDLDLATGRAFWTEQLEELFGLPPGGFEGDYRSWIRRVHPEDRAGLEAQLRAWVRERRRQVEFEYRFIRADGEVRWMSGSAQLSYQENGRPERMIGTTVDSTERKRLESEILHMVHHDTLTGLPNRRLFMDIINLEVAQAHRNRRKFALLFLDLDRFKEVNDTFGHNAGDELLKEVSQRIKSSIRESDAAARIGGDEFNIVLTDITHSDSVAFIVKKIMEAFQGPFIVAGLELRITASIGISVYPDDSEDVHTLFRFADIAMYHVKESGRNSFEFYNPNINVQSIERLQFENYLRQALVRGELAVYYQPQVGARTGAIVAAEALVRWKHPELGLLESKDFIRAAESIGIIAAIDEWVLRTACTQFKTWIDAGYEGSCVAVNLSARMFQSRDFTNIVTRILEETGLPTNRLEIEITESTAMADIERTAALLKTLADKGIGISIDDFGTGYSSLNYLKKLPIQRLKIDRSFVEDIVNDPDDRAIINAVTAMAHNMKMTVVAEGVETQDQLSFVNQANCDEAQGYLFSESLPADKFEELIAAGR